MKDETLPKDEANRLAVQAMEEADRLLMENELLRKALEKSVELQSHYAKLLNGYDGGERMQFTVETWLERMQPRYVSLYNLCTPEETQWLKRHGMFGSEEE